MYCLNLISYSKERIKSLVNKIFKPNNQSNQHNNLRLQKLLLVWTSTSSLISKAIIQTLPLLQSITMKTSMSLHSLKKLMKTFRMLARSSFLLDPKRIQPNKLKNADQALSLRQKITSLRLKLNLRVNRKNQDLPQRRSYSRLQLQSRNKMAR